MDGGFCMTGLKRGSVKLEAHQSGWQKEAENTIAELKGIFENIDTDIQHIGSTAVSSIHAKPIIDIAVGVKNPEDIFPFIEELNKKNYIFRGEDVPGQLLLVKGDFKKDTRTHHIHVVKWNGTEWKNYIDFRDYLNAFPKKAAEYDECKQKLAKRFPDNRKLYTEGKKKLIAELIEEVKVWKTKRPNC